MGAIYTSLDQGRDDAVREAMTNVVRDVAHAVARPDNHDWMDMRTLLGPQREFKAMALAGTPWVFVHQHHAVMRALLRADPRMRPIAVENEWFKIRQSTFDAMCCRQWLVARRWFWALHVLRARCQLLWRRRLAVAMACHARLGSASPLGALCPELVRECVP